MAGLVQTSRWARPTPFATTIDAQSPPHKTPPQDMQMCTVTVWTRPAIGHSSLCGRNRCDLWQVWFGPQLGQAVIKSQPPWSECGRFHNIRQCFPGGRGWHSQRQQRYDRSPWQHPSSQAARMDFWQLP